MVKYINFGEYNKNYKFIFLLVFFSILNLYLNDIIIDIFLNYKVSFFSNRVKPPMKNLISQNVQDLFDHPYNIDSITFLGMLAFSFILNKYESKRNFSSYKSNTLKSEKGCFNIIKSNEKKKKKKKN